ncbi:hypothetical protein SDC9_79415 [bioreactor metagenome]|uniref:Uncharacterized protein n=1 Tax=bioreactor metagenome TaxID=1076179 RepID=A0A644YX16_9ZZZZ
MDDPGNPFIARFACSGMRLLLFEEAGHQQHRLKQNTAGLQNASFFLAGMDDHEFSQQPAQLRYDIPTPRVQIFREAFEGVMEVIRVVQHEEMAGDAQANEDIVFAAPDSIVVVPVDEENIPFVQSIHFPIDGHARPSFGHKQNPSAVIPLWCGITDIPHRDIIICPMLSRHRFSSILFSHYPPHTQSAQWPFSDNYLNESV